ncbi:LytR/AlgR family response regulator transcription factor [Flavobacterium cerinum]|uniref:Response regulator transcription factor n=1 Tax=Flavobacterium cerinum TaxID=2502784 RepID=A0A3S4STW0_9FLAO|nr:LytTR family DNA-binding domain-containing protein [Flavobacterium cerinum]RWW92338.1 response regulator transcription factor [Flavobacterium cerinum]
MKQKITFLFLLSCCLSYGQSLSALITRNIEANPDSTIVSLKKLAVKSGSDYAKNQYIIGKCYAFLNKEDFALIHFINAKKEFDKLKNIEFSKDIALDAYLVISSQENYNKYGTSFLDEYYSYALKNNSDIRLAYAYSEYAKNAHDKIDENLKDQRVPDNAFKLFSKALVHAKKTNDDVIKGKVYGNIGTLMVTWQKYNMARSYLDSAGIYINRTGDRFHLFANNYSYANSYFTEGRDKEAIVYFLKAEKIQLPYYKGKSKRMLYKKIAETFDYLNNNKERREYEKKHDSLDSQIKDMEQNAVVHEINTKYEVEKKDRQINALQKIKMKLIQNKIVFSILLFLVFLLALYSFIRWKKIDYNKKRLEAEKKDIEIEHTKTVEQLEKVKQLVIEDHLILKNKSKIYLDKLIYIKAEDHYLNLVSTDGKRNFIRGKLSHLVTELPPNFVKCHRSYVVNKNYIKSVSSKTLLLTNFEEVPVSRSFKLE